MSQNPFPEGCGIGIKPVSKEGTQRLVRKAIQFAIENDKPSVTLVHKGNIMKYTEGAFKEWGYELALDRFGGELIDGGPWVKIKTLERVKTSLSKMSLQTHFTADSHASSRLLCDCHAKFKR